MIDNLLSFKKVVDEGSITSASKKLHITQPALTKKIQNLEKSFGIALLIRDNKGVQLTPEGKTVYEYAIKIANQWKELNRKLDYSQNKSLRITLGMIDNIAISLKDNFYKQISEKLNRIDLKVKINNSTKLISDVLSGTIDLAIITKPQKNYDELSYIDFHTEKLRVIANSAIAKTISNKKDLEKYPFASYNEESNTHKHIDETFKKNNLNIQYKVFSTSPAFIIKMVTNNNYLAVLPENLIEKYLKPNNLRGIELKDINFTRELVLIHKKDTFLNKDIAYFLDEIQHSI